MNIVYLHIQTSKRKKYHFAIYFKKNYHKQQQKALKIESIYPKSIQILPNITSLCHTINYTVQYKHETNKTIKFKINIFFLLKMMAPNGWYVTEC